MGVIHGSLNAAPLPDVSYFPYQPLAMTPTGSVNARLGSEVRTPTLKPREQTAPVECTLENDLVREVLQGRNNRDTKVLPEYEALSYTWGNAQATQTNRLTHVEIRIRENLRFGPLFLEWFRFALA
jgi:hypothetical protein